MSIVEETRYVTGFKPRQDFDERVKNDFSPARRKYIESSKENYYLEKVRDTRRLFIATLEQLLKNKKWQEINYINFYFKYLVEHKKPNSFIWGNQEISYKFRINIDNDFITDMNTPTYCIIDGIKTKLRYTEEENFKNNLFKKYSEILFETEIFTQYGIIDYIEDVYLEMI